MFDPNIPLTNNTHFRSSFIMTFSGVLVRLPFPFGIT